MLSIIRLKKHHALHVREPRGSIYTTVRKLGLKIPYNKRNYGSQFPNGCICGPSEKLRILGCARMNIGVILVFYWGYIRVVLGLYWGYLSVVLGLSWCSISEQSISARRTMNIAIALYVNPVQRT